tara:strand:- start:216 stop:503 length:288 start_codon:yes stop_codon:yes gene_type:complete
MQYDHQAIINAYPDKKLFIADGDGVYTANDMKVFEYDQSLVDAERTKLNKLLYKRDREREYPDWGEQLDYIYHNGIEKWKTDIVDPVKNKYPKPS